MMNRLTRSAIVIAIAAIVLPVAAQERSAQEEQMLQQMRQAARSQGMTLTPEMEEMALQRAREIQANMLGLQVGLGGAQRGKPEAISSTPAPEAASPPTIYAEAPSGSLLQAINERRAHAQLTAIDVTADGFDVNGRPFMDSAGAIETFAFDRATGDASYFVNTGNGTFAVKFTNFNSGLPPVTVGSFVNSRDRRSFTGIDGTELTGSDIIPLPYGLITTRQGAFFRYEFGKAPESFRLESGYNVLPMQAGDVIKTGWILTSRKAEETTMDRLLPSMRGSFFRNREADFALVNSSTGQAVTVPRSEPSTRFSRKQLYDAELGIPERHHYYNAIQWQQSTVGPVVVYLNDRGTEVLAINLETGQEVRLFRRGAGVNGFRTHRLENGHLGVTAQLAFKHETVSVEDAFSGLIESED